MQSPHSALARLSDDELLAEVKRLAVREREATAALIASLVELDQRKSYLGAGYSSLFTYCVQALGLSEDAAYFRIEAARAARKFPLILERLVAGAITLTAVKLLAPHMTGDNHEALLDEARGRTRREVEHIVARVAPRPDAPSLVRKLPSARASHAPGVGGLAGIPAVSSASQQRHEECPPSPPTNAATASLSELRFLAHGQAGARDSRETQASQGLPLDQARQIAAEIAPNALAAAAARRPAVVAPLAPERYKIQVTVGAETHVTLRRLQALLRHDIPDGDPAAIIDRALTVLLAHVERTKCAATKRAVGARKSGTALHSEAASGEGKPTGAATEAAVPLPMPSAADAASGPTRCERDLDPGGECREDVQKSQHGQLGSERVDPAEQEQADVTRRADRSGSEARLRSRYIPTAVRRAVWQRDSGRCTFVGTDGRCQENGLLEYHHVIPYANGGEPTVKNLRLACRRHNQLEAERFFETGEPRDG